jgi:hypothetical protein
VTDRDNERQRRNKERLRADVAAGRRDIPHGTESGYVRFGCHCDACRAANTAGQQRRRAWRREHGGTP